MPQPRQRQINSSCPYSLEGCGQCGVCRLKRKYPAPRTRNKREHHRKTLNKRTFRSWSKCALSRYHVAKLIALNRKARCAVIRRWAESRGVSYTAVYNWLERNSQAWRDRDRPELYRWQKQPTI